MVSNRPPQQVKNWEGELNTGKAFPGTNFSEKFLNPSKEKQAVIGKTKKPRNIRKGCGKWDSLESIFY
ncbi:MAG: hypothetical protein ACUVXA_13160 [Candidatus Jordarchaeum sp.]|uniref:hypothetical protein n=1 Tax=Candidatus Jordarchaeum sp. TaxID=2823881 RepID=UPI00404B5ADE